MSKESKDNPWKPMDTAPMDGSYILVYMENDEIFKVSFIESFTSQHTGKTYPSGFYRDTDINPLDPRQMAFWMPIIEPPTSLLK